MKKFFAALISVTLILSVTLGLNLSAAAEGFDFELERGGEKITTLTTDSLYMVSLDTGDVVFNKNADVKRAPASTTKIMTYIVVAENIDDFENTYVPIKQETLDKLDGTDSSLAGVERYVGKNMSVKDLLYSMMIPSGNDAALVLAEFVGGSEAVFADLMNAKAQELGCTNTHFANSHGLDDPDHYTTARDMSKIAEYALTMPMFSEIVNTTTYYCEGEDEYPLITTNSMIDENRGGEYYYKYARGIKTGTTDDAGRCLVSTAVYEGYSYLIVAYHAPMEGTNYAMIDSANLYRWAFLNLELKPVVNISTPIAEQKLDLAWNKDGVLLTSEENYSTVLPASAQESDVKIEPHTEEIIDAPVNKGDILGTADIYYKGEKIKTVNLIASESVERSGLLYFWRTVKGVLSSKIFLVCAAIAIILIIAYIILAAIFGKNKRKSRNRVRNYRNF